MGERVKGGSCKKEMAAEGFNQEAPPWLKSLPVAPEYRPTMAEFRDPIGYILKIEREASRFGICKIVPPVPPPPKKTAAAHLARSFAARHPSKEPAFTTRQQQVGFCPRRPRPVQKPVWQSGDWYTLPEFEAKAKQFEKSQLRKCGKKSLAPLEVEALFWKACAGRPFSVEYANDLPGSGFAPIGSGKGLREAAAGNVGETAWNMRGVSRAEGSLLRFMKEEIPGVTSPMVYVAMMFSWFAWHVEDHELHSLNYLHMGAGKTWYGVPRDARLAFEDVVRVHGYGEEVNPLVTFATLGEKTTVMSPEVLISAGIPCCRLVQNAGEFVVTFPGAYHSGFSHGFNCGEAANIATPEWLKVAKEAAIRRASTNCPPMVSHFQLLYALALSLCSRMPVSSSTEPRSSRLKDKMRCEGEIMVKDTFIRNVIENNSLVSVLLDKGSYCIVLPQKAADSLSSSDSKIRSQVKVKPRMSLGLCSHQEAIEASGNLLSGDTMGDQNMGIGHLNGFGSMKANFFSIYEEKSPLEKCSRFRTVDCRSSISDLQSMEGGKESTLQNRGLLDQGLLSCVTCGILSFACMAVLQPSETAAKFFMSADCSSFNDQTVVSGEISDIDDGSNHRSWNYELLSSTGGLARHAKDRLHDDFIDCSTPSIQVSDQGIKLFSDTLSEKKISALELLASAYGNSSDSEDEEQHKMPVSMDQNDLIDSMLTSNTIEQSTLRIVSGSKLSAQESGLVDGSNLHRLRYANEDKSDLQSESLPGIHAENPVSNVPYASQNHKELEAFSSAGHYKSVDGSCRGLGRHHTACLDSGFLNDSKNENSESGLSHSYVDRGSGFDPAAPTSSGVVTKQISNIDASVKISDTSAMQRCDKDSSRMHIFCLEHAIEVEKQLRPKGGVHIMLLCHPDYPKLEEEAKLLAEELEMDHQWKDIPFREATKEDQERIRMALEDEEAIPTNSDWAVKMGINLYYSASLSKAPLYSKQMPYNAIIYRTFSCNTRGFSPVMPKVSGRKAGRQKKIVAGKWCGKVWMSNQVHPFLVQASDDEEEEDVGELQVEGTDPKPESETASANSSRSTRKSGRKRKKSSRKSSAKRNRCNQSGNNSCNSEDAAGDSSAPCQMVLRSRASSCKKIISWHRKSSTSRKGCDQPGNGSSIIEDSAEDCSEQCGKVLRSGTSSHKKTASWHKSNLKDKAEGAPSKHLKRQEPVSKQVKSEPRNEKQDRNKKSKTSLATKEEEVEYACDVEGCSMSFSTKQDLALHKRNICPVEGCRKKFFSHKYMVQHRKVHMDDRPLKCPWKGCKMSFKWPWARTEHIRVHTGDRPYICREAGCGQTFRFVSDFSRHKRKTGHVSAKRKRG